MDHAHSIVVAGAMLLSYLIQAIISSNCIYLPVKKLFYLWIHETVSVGIDAALLLMVAKLLLTVAKITHDTWSWHRLHMVYK